MKTENKILASARRIFILYGYHGATIEKIARDAEVSKSIIHYYFRTKNNLYQEILEMIADSHVLSPVRGSLLPVPEVSKHPYTSKTFCFATAT